MKAITDFDRSQPGGLSCIGRPGGLYIGPSAEVAELIEFRRLVMRARRARNPDRRREAVRAVTQAALSYGGGCGLLAAEARRAWRAFHPGYRDPRWT